MSTTYAQCQVSAKNKGASSATSVLDSSAQSDALQRKADMANNAAQRAEAPRPNNTGMPDNLKAGIESLSGFSMDSVRVHYNSSKPATVQALAYTQGTDIHVAPGQEKCLPHEAWHVAQQMAGRVSPTTNINGMPVNDNAGLEHEADVMGEKAVTQRKKCSVENACNIGGLVTQRVVQMAGHADTFLTPPADAPYLLKIVGQKEYDQYDNIFEKQWNETNEIVQNTYKNTFPLVYSLFHNGVSDKHVQINDVTAVIPNTEDNTDVPHEYVVAIQKLNKIGGENGHLYDFKIGKKTASKKELVQNGYKNSFTATIKKWKMNLVDWKTESSKYGVRDSDNTSDINGIGNYVRSLSEEDRQAFINPFNQQCEDICSYIQQADTLYIASSILVGYGYENDLVVKLIDLAHPVTARSVGPGRFDKYRTGMLLGIQNLMNIVNGAGLDTRVAGEG